MPALAVDSVSKEAMDVLKKHVLQVHKTERGLGCINLLQHLTHCLTAL
jgi:hypothetical protein